MRVLVTGGAGFIGSHFAKRLQAAGDDVRVLDKLTYSGNPANLDGTGIELVAGDICDAAAVAEAAEGCDAIVNFAAETHVDRSILGPAEFIQTNVAGTQVLLDCARAAGIRLVHVSTDEVYGDVADGVLLGRGRPAPSVQPVLRRQGGRRPPGARLGPDVRGRRTDHPRLQHVRPHTSIPRSCCRCSSTNALDGEPLPMYGDGNQVRDWLFVEDHCAGIEAALRHRPSGRGIQHRRRRGGNEPGDHGSRARAHWRRGFARPSRRRPRRTRPPLLARHERRRARSSAGHRRRRLPRASRSQPRGTRATVTGGSRSSNRAATGSTTSKQYAARLAGS